MPDPQIPDEAVEAFEAAAWAYERNSHRTGRWDRTDQARAGLAAAYPILAEQWRRELDEGPDAHVIDVRDDGWTIRHPLSCRPNLFDCEVNRAAGPSRQLPVDPGRYACWTDDQGVLNIGDPVVDGG